MQDYALPACDINPQIRSIDGNTHIYDIVRKKYVRLTPEEWTRQHLIHHLIYDLMYPKSLIRVEKIIQKHYRKDRPDIVVYNRAGIPFLVAECKASHVTLSMEVYTQLSRYNRKLQAPLCIITNGTQYACWQIKDDVIKSLENIPVWSS